MRGLAVVGSSANAEGRRNCRAARRSSKSREKPAAARGLSGARGTTRCAARRERERVQSFIRAYKQQTNGGQATLKDEPTPQPNTQAPQHPAFSTPSGCPFYTFASPVPSALGPRAPIWVCRKYLGTAYARTAFAPTTIMTTISSNSKGLINTLAQSPTGGSSVRHRRAPPPSAHGPRGAFAAPRGPACLRHRLGAGS